MSGKSPLKFIVAPHIVQDLGLNLYTTLPKVLAEFVANAHDADSPWVKISLDTNAVKAAREKLKKEYDSEVKSNSKAKVPVPLAQRTLDSKIKIVITDRGCGMSRNELQNKFLVAGRRRREQDGATARTPKGRILMGRKGLGKLAGFGVAKVVRITSRAKGESSATQFELDYDTLIKAKNTSEIQINDVTLPDGGGLTGSGTRIELMNLLYEPMKARLETIASEIADHFALIDEGDFKIQLEEKNIAPARRRFSYAWPNPDIAKDRLIDSEFTTDDGRTMPFRYRLRFTADEEALNAKDRGIRVYAHHRLAAAPSLLDADTNMHGFRMTDYLDGVVYADFIDDQPEDYIATDRQGLRWDTPLLAPLLKLLSAEIKKACAERQKVRDEEKEDEVSNDSFTKIEIEKAGLSKQETKAAFKIAGTLCRLHKKGLKDSAYKTQFKEVIAGIGRGEILTSLLNLSKQSNPDFERVTAEVTRLTAEQLDGFFQYVKARINGINALRKIVGSRDFAAKNKERELHTLLMNCPWLIDPTYFEFLTSDKREDQVFVHLAKELGIGSYVATTYKRDIEDERSAGGQNKRPDLVFLLGNSVLNRIVIVELKAPNTPLHGVHYRQLQGYVRDTEKWLKRQSKDNTAVEGLLIGSKAPIKNNSSEVEWLENELETTKNQGKIRVLSIDKMLEQAERVHKGLLDAYNEDTSSDRTRSVSQRRSK